MKKNIHKKEYGFSLIETLIAVSILMIAIAGPLSLVQAGLFSSVHQRNQVVATYLAQEAIEYIKNIRDTNFYKFNGGNGDSAKWLAYPDGSASLIDLCGGSIGCYVDPHNTIPSSGAGGDGYVQTVGTNVWENLQPMYQHYGGSQFLYYGYGSGTITPYRRVVKITPVTTGSEDHEVTVSVTVGWKDGTVPRTYTVSENIYNYQQQATLVP